MNSFNGMRVVTSLYMTVAVETTVRRTWRERLRSRPWQRTKIVITHVPNPGSYTIGNNTIVMHPATWQGLMTSKLICADTTEAWAKG